jgi:RHS repeat-associated protein
VFTYDPVYRLRSATGREQQTPVGGDPWTDLPRATDPTQTQHYTERYFYDPVGNLRQLVHQPTATHLTSGFTREFVNQPGNNRLQLMTVSGTPYHYSFDDNGNLVTETASRHLTWNHTDQLAAFATQTPGAEPSVHAHYLYDATGERVVKLVRRQGNLIEVTRYVGGFEHHRWAGGANNHIHVRDDNQRIALARTGQAHPDDRGPAVAFQLTDHLGSSVATLDGTGTLINREEYTPYGETSFGSFARKRYRYSAKERDEDSGLYYHGARYYAPWLGRWLSADPAGFVDSFCLYEYAKSSPANFVDPEGTGVLDFLDAATDFVFPGKAIAKALIAGDVEKAIVSAGPIHLAGPLRPLSEQAQLGLLDVEVDQARQVAKTAAGPAYAIYERGSAFLHGDLAGAFPEVAGVLRVPLDLGEGIGKIAHGDIRGGVHQAAPAAATIVGGVRGIARGVRQGRPGGNAQATPDRAVQAASNVAVQRPQCNCSNFVPVESIVPLDRVGRGGKTYAPKVNKKPGSYRGVTPTHRAEAQRVGTRWGGPGNYDVGHRTDLEFVEPGEQVKFRAEAPGRNRAGGNAVAKAAESRKKAGLYTRGK